MLARRRRRRPDPPAAAAGRPRQGGTGNDVVFAVIRSRATIDCGPGFDTVFRGRKRPLTRNCERVVNRYAR